MTEIIYFSKRAFNKGVNDALTLRPLREAVKGITVSLHPQRDNSDKKTAPSRGSKDKNVQRYNDQRV